MNRRSCMHGLTLVELMIAMVLGLVVVGGAISLTLANRQSYRTNEGLSQLQESARTAFELIGRDVRQAGVLGCDNNTGRVANNLNDQGSEWWRTWLGIKGFTGGQNSSINRTSVLNERVDTTAALQLQGMQGTPFFVDSHNAGTFSITLNATAATALAAELQAGNILIACDFDHSTIFRATNYNASTFVIQHDQQASPSKGNCSRGLDFPNDCSSTVGNAYAFPRNAQIGRLFATEWYIGNNGRTTDSGRSLFRSRLGPLGNLLAPEEIVAGVFDMQIDYRVAGSTAFVPAGDATLTSAAQWATVNAIRLTLTVESADTRISTNLSTNSGRLRKSFTQIITLRNRVP